MEDKRIRDDVRGGLDLRRSEEDDNFDLDAKFAEAQRRSAAAAEVARQHEALEEEARLAEERTRLARERLKLAEDEAQRKAEEVAGKKRAEEAGKNGGKKKIDTQSFKAFHAGDDGGTTEEESPGVDSPTNSTKRKTPRERLAEAKAKAAEKAAARRRELEQGM